MTNLCLAQLSDIHISDLGDHHDMLSGHSVDFLTTTIARLNQREDLTAALLTGDLFDTAGQSELERFGPIIQRLKKPYYVIPGNHDRCSPSQAEGLTHRQFAAHFNPQFQERPTRPEAQSGYWSLSLNSEVQLIGLDSIRDNGWGGVIEATQLAWLNDQLAAHTGKFIIVAVHHPLHRLAPIDDHPDWGNFVCANGPEVIALLDQHPQVKVVLTGHHHQTKADRLGRRLHLACPAMIGYPCAYRILHLTRLSGDAWQFEWHTHPATDETTIAEARQRMGKAWREAGFAADFIEAYVQLAWGNEWDRHGVVEWPA